MLILLSATLIFFDRQQNHFSKIRSVLSLFVMPIEYAVDWPIQWVSRIVTSISSHESLRQENVHLRAEHILLQAQLQKYVLLEKENQQLHALLQSAPRTEGKMAAARALALDLSPLMQQIVVDRGTQQGVYLGQAVLDADGVVGQVVQSGWLTSRVLLISDSQSAVPVIVERTGVRAVIEGQGSFSRLALINVPKTADIEVGDTLVTSGLAQRFPEGYPVGQVVSIIDRSGEDFVDIEVVPSARLNRSQLVLLVWPSVQEQELYASQVGIEDNDDYKLNL